MSILSLALVIVVLVSRLPLLLLERRVKAWEVALAWVLQLLAAFGLVRIGQDAWLMISGFAALHALIHLRWHWLETRRHASRQLVRLLSSAALVLVAISLGSPWTGARIFPLASWLAKGQSVLQPLGLLTQVPVHDLLLMLVGILLCFSEINTLVRLIIERMNLEPKGFKAGEEANAPGLTDSAAIIQYQRGRLIGVLERLMVLALVLNDQFGALGFVLAAKAMARFKSLDDRNFADYFILGTLLSVALAVALALGLRGLLGSQAWRLPG